MVIKLFYPMSVDVAYLDEDNKPLAYKAEIKGACAVDLIHTKEGFTTFQLVGDQYGVWDGGLFTVPFAVWDEVK